MRTKTIMGTILAVFILSAFIIAQEQTEQKIELPERTPEWKLGRSVRHMDLFICTGIAYAKSLGKTAEDYGKFVGEKFAPSWEGAKGQGVAPLIRTWSGHWQLYKNGKFEIVSESETSVTTKFNRPYSAYFKDGDLYGVTVNEYETFLEKIGVAIANYLGLKYEQKVEGDNLIVTISKQK
ncbi:MAG: hypothetical protein GQ545_03530 [Candidatus Aminicenantes bacterium]|nr:hypothetical protein [Candidatus Aminicenantes bacterium]